MSALRQLVVAALLGDGSRPWGDRVVDTAGALADEDLPWLTGGQQPFVVVRLGIGATEASSARYTMVEVWPHGPMTSWTGIDTLEDRVTAILDQQMLATDPNDPDLEQDGYVLSYEGSPLGDQVVPEWDAWTRPLRFRAARLAWYGPDDPRAAFLRSVTPAFLCLPEGACAQTDPTHWLPTDDCPGVFWRPATSPQELERYPWLTLYVETLAGHVVAPSKEARQAWVDRIALAIPGDTLYVEPDVADGGSGVPPRRSTMLLRLASTNLEAEPLSEGQIRLEIQFSVLACDYFPTPGRLVQATQYIPEGVHTSAPPPNPPQEVPVP